MTWHAQGSVCNEKALIRLWLADQKVVEVIKENLEPKILNAVKIRTYRLFKLIKSSLFV